MTKEFQNSILVAENEQLTSENERLKAEQNQTDAALQDEQTRQNDELNSLKSQLYAAKKPIIQMIVKDDKSGSLTEDILQTFNIDDLTFILNTFHDIATSEYEYVVNHRRQREQDSKKRESSPMGIYNQQTGKWEGGMVIEDEEP